MDLDVFAKLIVIVMEVNIWNALITRYDQIFCWKILVKITYKNSCHCSQCFCMYPLHRTYDNSLKKCVSLFGSSCDLAADDETSLPRCARNSVCENNRCLCQEGYFPTSKLLCMVGHGLECGPFQCNIEAGLACKSGICSCLDSSYIYSAVSRSCFDPESFIKNFLKTWFDRTFIRDVIIHKIFEAFRRITRILKSPIRWLKRFRLFG